jgi:hypothetical protein
LIYSECVSVCLECGGLSPAGFGGGAGTDFTAAPIVFDNFAQLLSTMAGSLLRFLLPFLRVTIVTTVTKTALKTERNTAETAQIAWRRHDDVSKFAARKLFTWD